MRRKAIHPVIATVIIVAVAIAIALAIGFWLTGLSGIFTRFEELKILSSYTRYDPATNTFNIVMQVKNTGNVEATINNIFVNNVPIDDTTISSTINGTPFLPGSTYTIPPGNTVIVSVHFIRGARWPPGSTEQSRLDYGVSLEIKIHTTSGNDYPRLIKL